MLTLPTASDYLWQFQRLLPHGRVWHRGWGSIQAAHLLTLMPTWVRVHGRGNDLVEAIFPCSTVELLPEWEATLGLPDPCVQPPLSTIQQRTAAVCLKFAARGGSSRDYFIHLAASYGFQVEIETFTPFRVNHGRVGGRLYSTDWAFAWRVVVQGAPGTVTYFRVGQSAAGEPLAAWGIKQLECLFETAKPAETEIIWSYTVNSSVWDAGASLWDGGDSVWDKGVFVP